MERTKKDKRLKWQKHLNSGSFWMGQRIIKPGEVFLARRDEIPVAFLDTISCLEEEQLAEIEAAEKGDVPPKVMYERFHRGGGYYDVRNIETKDNMNDKALREDDADELLNTLNGVE